MKHRIVTAAQMKAIEQAGNAHGLPYLQMMENAGLAVYAELKKALPQPSTLLVVCGKGNNGGDGFVIARAAAKEGWKQPSFWPKASRKRPMPSQILNACTACRWKFSPTVPDFPLNRLPLSWMRSTAPDSMAVCVLPALPPVR